MSSSARQQCRQNQRLDRKLHILDTRSSTCPTAEFNYKDYLEMIYWTDRIIRHDMRSAISPALPPILERLDIQPKQ